MTGGVFYENYSGPKGLGTNNEQFGKAGVQNPLL